MESDRKPYGELVTVWNERWASRRKFAGGLNATFGLLIALPMIAGSAYVDTPADKMLMGIFAGFGILQLVAGIGLFRGYGWGAVILCIYSVLYLLAFPLGTVLGGYTLWVLFNTRHQTGLSRTSR